MEVGGSVVYVRLCGTCGEWLTEQGKNTKLKSEGQALVLLLHYLIM